MKLAFIGILIFIAFAIVGNVEKSLERQIKCIRTQTGTLGNFDGENFCEDGTCRRYRGEYTQC